MARRQRADEYQMAQHGKRADQHDESSKALLLGDGSSVSLPVISRNGTLGLDFSSSPRCESCDGHAGGKGFPEGGYEMVEFQMSGMTYRSTAACPHCVFGAFRNQVQSLGWPADVVAYWDRRERRDTDMAENKEYTKAPGKVSELVGDVVGEIGGF